MSDYEKGDILQMVKKVIQIVLASVRVIMFMVGFILMMCETDDINNQIPVIFMGVLLIAMSLVPSMIKAAVESLQERDYYLK